MFKLAKDLMGAYGMLDAGPDLDAEWHQWARGFLFSPALTVGGGTSEVLRNIIGERLLGLPHDADVEAGKTWAETARQRHRPRLIDRHAIHFRMSSAERTKSRSELTKGTR